MSDTQIPALDHTVQQTNLWLKKLIEAHHFEDRHQAYNALRAVIQTLRDQLTVEQAVHLSAQLPMLVRGIFFEGYHLGADRKAPHVAQFESQVADRLPPSFSRAPSDLIPAVFELLSSELDPGLIAKLIDELPVPLRSLWPSAARR